jgi:hypothetical protein
LVHRQESRVGTVGSFVEDEGRGNAFHPEGSFFYNLAWLASALKEWEPLEIVRAWVCFANNPVRSFGSEHEFSRETLVCLALYLLPYNNKVAWVEASFSSAFVLKVPVPLAAVLVQQVEKFPLFLQKWEARVEKLKGLL